MLFLTVPFRRRKQYNYRNNGRLGYESQCVTAVSNWLNRRNNRVFRKLSDRLQNNSCFLKINQPKMVAFFRLIEIKVGIQKLVIYDSDMFQSNEVSGFFTSKNQQINLS